MSARSKPPFRADHVGSFLRPQALLEARDRRKKGEITPQALRAVEEYADQIAQHAALPRLPASPDCIVSRLTREQPGTQRLLWRTPARPG